MDFDRRLLCKIVEAKNLKPAANQGSKPVSDPFVEVALDERCERTPVIHNNHNPFWAEDFSFENVKASFQHLRITVYDHNQKQQQQQPASPTASSPGGADQPANDDHCEPIGQISFPRTLITSGQIEEEQWFPLVPQDVDSRVSGNVRVKVVYFPPKKNQIAVHTFAVTVMEARGLAPRQGSPATANPYVVGHLLPDAIAASTQATHIVNGSLSPMFGQTLIFSTPLLHPTTELHIAIWHAVGLVPSKNDTFMGHTVIPLNHLQTIPKTDKWYILLPKPYHMGRLKTMSVDKSRLDKTITNASALIPPKLFALAFQNPDLVQNPSTKITKAIHRFVDAKLTSLSFCCHCSGIMWAMSAHVQCKECRAFAHAKCSRLAANNCGGISLLRMKVRTVSTPILPVSMYDPFMSLILGNQYALCTLLGKLSQERKEAARSLVRLQSTRQQVVPMLIQLIKNEVSTATDPNTLFRANSMASKALEVYMLDIGAPYLRKVLEPSIAEIMRSTKSCELDPSKLVKGQRPELNQATLLHFCRQVSEAIFASEAYFPPQFRDVFAELRKEVVKRFPNDPTVKYTAISGFLFLRFFAPAVLGPKLFGLVQQYYDERTARTFTLVAKVLQSLANLVEFGQKEAFMLPMNQFLIGQFDTLKVFINQVSQPDGPVDMLSTAKPNIVNAAKESARLFDVFVRETDKLAEAASGDVKPLLPAMFTEMRKLVAILESASAGDEDAKAAMENGNRAMIRPAGQEDPVPSTVFTKLTNVNERERRRSSVAAIMKRTDSVQSPDPVSMDAFNWYSTSPRPEPNVLRRPSDQQLQAANQSVNTAKQALRDAVNASRASAPSSPTLADDVKDGLPSAPVQPPAPPASTNGVVYESAGLCTTCHQDIRGPFVDVLGGRRHSQCFKCTACQCQLTSFVVFENQPYCRQDYLKRAGLMCGVCGDTIDREYTEIMGRKYHINCRKCDLCNTILAGRPFFSINGSVYCEDHRGSLINCHSCQQPIGGNVLIALKQQRQFHPEHFSCQKCTKNLSASPFFEKDDRPYCHQCYFIVSMPVKQ